MEGNKTKTFADRLVEATVALIRATPYRPKQLVASLVARLLFVAWRSRRRAAIRWASRALGLPIDHPDTVATARRSMINFAKFALEFVESSTMPRDQLARSKFKVVRNGEVIEGMGRKDQGCLFISAHVGNWELLGVWVSLHARRFNAVVLPLEAPSLNRFAARTRELNGFNLIGTEGGARDVLRALKRGEWVAVLADRPVAQGGERVVFLGEPGSHPVGLVRIAKRAGVPVIFGGCWSDGNGLYEGEILPALRADDPALSVDELIERAVINLEYLVKRQPDQWFIAFTSGPHLDVVSD